MTFLKMTYAIVLALLTTNATAHAIVGGTEPDPDDTRFDAVAAFSLTAWLTNDNNAFCNGTLIAPDMVIMASHCIDDWRGQLETLPSGHFSFRFRRQPDGSLGSIAQGWDSFYHVPVSHFTLPRTTGDTLIAHLAHPVTHIEPIAIADWTMFGPGDQLLLAAWGREGPNFREGPRGRLTIARTSLTAVDWMVHFPDAWDPNNPCGCGANSNDSGGAQLVERLDLPPYAPTGAGSDTSADAVLRPRVEILAVIGSIGSGSNVHIHQLISPCYWEDNTTHVDRDCPQDLDGDRDTDADDVLIILENLGPCPCGDPCDYDFDFNDDGVVDQADVQFVMDHVGTACPCPSLGRCEDEICVGDMNNDNRIDEEDLAILEAMLPYPASCVECGDINNDGVLDVHDIDALIARYNAECPCDMTFPDTNPNCVWDISGDGFVDELDLSAMYFIHSYAGCNERIDMDGDGTITRDDYDLLQVNFGPCP